VRVRIADGHWPAVHAACLTGAATPPGSVAVTIQAADAAGVAPLVFHAPALTPRRREIARQLFAGLPNSEIARQLDISPSTVQDHVKAVLDKLGVHGRRELVAGILGRRL
jgi:DNA-binding NarL/FixJ family response regulator